VEELATTSIMVRLLAILALVAANGFFVAVEFAVVSVGERRARLENPGQQRGSTGDH
jgi:CBS domain containing-hemolysin-like protein